MKIFAVFWVVLFVLFCIYAPATKSVATQFAPSPAYAKLFTGSIGALWSDFLWIGSVKDGERKKGSFGVDNNRFYNRFEAIAILNPDFFLALRYASLYLAGVSNDVNASLKLIDTAKNGAVDKSRIAELEADICLAYENPPDFNRLRKIGISDAAVYAIDNEDKRQAAISDLSYIIKTTKNTEQQNAAREMLQKVLNKKL